MHARRLWGSRGLFVHWKFRGGGFRSFRGERVTPSCAIALFRGAMMAWKSRNGWIATELVTKGISSYVERRRSSVSRSWMDNLLSELP
jgi:hypothetical protein